MSMPTGIGVIDLQTGFPHSSVAEKVATYAFFRANLKDRESLEEMEFPAEYMFKDVPDLVPEGTDVIAWTLGENGCLRHRYRDGHDDPGRDRGEEAAS